MANCPSCASVVPEGNRFCGSCGSPIETPTSAPTETSLKSQPVTTFHPPLDKARFIPGTILAKRYRIISLLGRGGMGEVYRADDLKLGQPVALKFLPAAVERDQARLDRFLNEVKTALKVTHPNVCRVFDIGEVDSQHYISMEYVDGEDLASLLRRIERLPQNKAVQIARQLCAGLAAAHDQGILHRDLKPANVMIDGRGRAKITDFGLAGLAEGIEGDEVRAGTPQYMSPEQHFGKEVSTRSDIYSLGLVLYELFTGKRALEATTAAEIRKLQEQSFPTTPSSHVEGLDPAVERVILRCLEKKAAARPPSALAVAAALPGGDPLAAALAAGETPSPEMVAAAGGEGRLKPFVAWSCLGFVVLAWVAGFLLMREDRAGSGQLFNYAPLKRPPAVLDQDARDILEALGYPDDPADTAHGFWINERYLEHIEETVQTQDRWERLRSRRPPATYFWYRQSPEEFNPRNWWPGDVTTNDPHLRVAGDILLWLDIDGRLHALTVIPPEQEPEEAPEPDWSALFEAAALDQEAFTPTPSEWVPDLYCDARRAWSGAWPESPEIPIRLEACAFAGKIVRFEIFAPWSEPARTVRESESSPQRAWMVAFWVVFLGLLGTAGVLAVKNVRTRRGDLKGATRLTLFFVFLLFARWLLAVNHRSDIGEIDLFLDGISFIIAAAVMVWAVYVAVEPLLRRRWPQTLVSWNRVLAGRIRDPLVGRDMLAGIVAWWAFVVLSIPIVWAPKWLDLLPARPLRQMDLAPLLGPKGVGVNLIDSLLLPIVQSMGLLFLLLLLCTVVRKMWLAVVVVFLFTNFANLVSIYSNPAQGLVAIAQNALFWGCLFILVSRFGLLSLCLWSLSAFLSLDAVVGAESAGWYQGIGTFFTLALAALLLYAVFVSQRRPGRASLLGDGAVQDSGGT